MKFTNKNKIISLFNLDPEIIFFYYSKNTFLHKIKKYIFLKNSKDIIILILQYFIMKNHHIVPFSMIQMLNKNK